MSLKGIESGEAMGTPTIGPVSPPAMVEEDRLALIEHQTRQHGMTLWELEEQLVGLMHAAEDPDISPEDKEAVDQAIVLYVHKEIRKVDRIREYLRMCELGAQAAKEEAARHHQWSKMWETRKERIKAACKMAMEAFGARRLDGRSGYLLLKNNGGLRGLTIADPVAIPDSYCDYRITLTGDKWLKLCQWFDATDAIEAFESLGEPERIPNQNRIRAALELPCPNCAGKGEVPATAGSVHDRWPCPKCNATGKFLVPGARLEERGSHVEVK